MKLDSGVLLALLLSSCATVHHAPGQKAGGDTAFVCHKGKKTLELPSEAVDAHIQHGDEHGRCQP
jgi:hypothetical protein